MGKKAALRKKQHVHGSSHIVFISGMITLCMFFLIGLLFQTNLISGRIPLFEGTDDERIQNTIEYHIDTVSKLEMDYNDWLNMDSETKLEVLQTVADIETDYLGIPFQLNVHLANLPGSVLGCYSDRAHIIRIDSECFHNGSPDKLLEVVCHECYHAYQYCLCDVYGSMDTKYRALVDFKRVQTYQNEFNDYTDGSEDIDRYLAQKCEKDAYEYAENAVEDYHLRIRQLLDSGE